MSDPLETDPWCPPLPLAARRKYWTKVVRLLADRGWQTLDDKILHWPTIERVAAARGYSAKLVTDPRNMADRISEMLPPPNF